MSQEVILILRSKQLPPLPHDHAFVARQSSGLWYTVVGKILSDRRTEEEHG